MPWERFLIALLVVGQLGLLVVLAAETGITVDEPSHLLSAHLYWEGRDTLQPGHMPPLINLTAGWVPRLVGLRLPEATDPVWRTNHEWNISQRMIDGMSRAELQRIFFWSRLPLTLFPLLSTLLLWWWGRQLFSPAGGLFSAALFALSPMVLGHGALFKNDLASAFGYLAFWYSAWRYWERPDAGGAARWGVALVLAVLAKISMLILIPMAFVLLAIRELTWRPLRPALSLSRILLVGVVLYGGIVLAWQADLTPIPAAELDSWQTSPAIPSWISQIVKTASWIPLPPRFWHGAVEMVRSNGEHGAVYLMGQIFPEGHPLYFVTALAVKVPVAMQLAIGLGLCVYAVRVARRRAGARDLFWAVPGLFYISLASLSNLQLGIRLIAPAWPFLLLWAGPLATLRGRWRIAGILLPAALVTWSGWRTAVHYPHYISHFNLWAGGPQNGLRYLSDSNIDWGQDLRFLAEYVTRNDIRKIRLAYFGMDDPYNYLTDERLETLPAPWSDDLAKGERFVPEPGYYAVSANLLTGQYFAPKYRNYFAGFRESEPVGRAGYSIFIYRIP